MTRSFKKRVDWLMDQLETDDESFAEAEMRRSDDAHAARMHAQFGVTWGDPLLYDLVLNTDRVSVESCVAQIQQLAARPEFQETAESRAMLADLALNARIRAALKDHDSTRDINITIESQRRQGAYSAASCSMRRKARRPPGSPAQSSASATSTTSCA